MLQGAAGLAGFEQCKNNFGDCFVSSSPDVRSLFLKQESKHLLPSMMFQKWHFVELLDFCLAGFTQLKQMGMCSGQVVISV